jgi:gliding motility-associated-like protein
MRLTFILFLLIFPGILGVLNATHNRAGEITYRHLGGYRFEATITTYTKADSQADRANLGIHWGDGTVDTIPRLNGGGSGELIAPDLKKNIYKGTHIYPGPAVYRLFFEDPNRNGGVVNIPNSVNVPFYVSSQLIINPFIGINNSVQLLNPPIDKACPGQLFIHNAGAWDPDGDSISYRLVSCLGEAGQSIPGFSQPPAANSFGLNPLTGDLIWDFPPFSGVGEYNVAFVIEEWRKGVLIGSVTRDMQIDVVPCTNTPPRLAEIPPLCILAGELVKFKVKAWDADFPKNLITLSASGGPLLQAPPGQAQFASVTGTDTISQEFSWQTSCSHVRKQPWFLSFRVGDNGNPNLADYQSTSIRVVAPAPELTETLPQGNGIRISWSESPCKEASGYDLYRKAGASSLVPGNCITGIPDGYGFVRIASLSGLQQLNHTDSSGITPAITYCYRVVARFPDGAESYASNELCTTLKKDLPVITHVSVINTSVEGGSIRIAWQPATELDTLQWPGPYIYEIERAIEPSSSIWTLAGSSSDTSFIDSALVLNTIEFAWRYRIALRQVSSNELIGRSIAASSLFLNLGVEDNAIRIRFGEKVPWANFSYTLYRKDPGASVFDSIASFSGTEYLDTGLANGVEYCYRLRSAGSYGLVSPQNAYLNFSQESCLAADDLVPPCSATLLVNTSCDSMRSNLTWGFPLGCSGDLFENRLYFKPSSTSEPQLLESWQSDFQYTYIYEPENSLAGCYQIVSLDSAGNQSASSWVCTDNCPEYRLPDAFSPNNDGSNDLFRPYPFLFIEQINLEVYNRWGIKVFQTNEPEINWDGKDMNSGALLPDGVYFYVCRVDEIRLDGVVSRTIKGKVSILGTSGNQNE